MPVIIASSLTDLHACKESLRLLPDLQIIEHCHVVSALFGFHFKFKHEKN